MITRGFFVSEINRGRKHGIFAVNADIAVKPSENHNPNHNSLTIRNALVTVFQQMRIAGNRIRTIDSYSYVFMQFSTVNNLKYVEDITSDSIYNYLDSLEVKQTTKKIRLKTLKAVLGKFYNNGWIVEKFWSNIHIKIDKEVKKATKESDIDLLLELIDQTTFVGFRDAVAIKLLYKTGIRIRTLAELKERHIDFKNLCLSLDGAVMKNHNFLKLPIDGELAMILKALIEINNNIREHYETDNSNVFITQNGQSMATSKSSNCAISKQLYKYSKKYGLENINAHAIRRAYSKNLLEKGASVALISKALGHSDIAVTTQYLDIDVEEVASSLRDFL